MSGDGMQLNDAALNAALDQALREARIRDWVRSCLAKRRYKAEAGAKDAIRRRRTRVKLYAYYCTHCGGWHLTRKLHT